MMDTSRQDALKQMRARLEWWDREIERLKERVRKMTLNERLALNAPLQALIADREHTQRQVQQLERETGETWTGLMSELDDTWKKMDSTLRRTGYHPHDRER